MSIRALSSLNEMTASDWDALWADYPFSKHAFLSALENTGCTTRASGWEPSHLVYEKEGAILGVFPLYLKTNSWGEYVFDWAWAEAYAQHGLAYYPKLINAIPFTPATGPRFGFAQALNESERKAIALKFIHHCRESELAKKSSGFHSLFPHADDIPYLKTSALSERRGYQFHWFNKNYASFDSFLATFSSRKRKNIKRERERVSQAKLEIVVEEGEQITTERWQTFFIFYHTTYLKRSGAYGYLNKAFFEQLAATLKEQVILISALRENEPLAMALYFRDSETLYGRYWGCTEDVDCLHFELCYYQGIEYAIKHKLKRFDPGAQGEHKIQRGFTPVYTCSYHALNDPRFQHAIERFLPQERQQLQYYMQDARAALPFRNDVRLVEEDALLGACIRPDN